MSARIRGSEVSILMTEGTEVVEEFNRVRNFNFMIKGETSSEGYLGEKTNRTDDNFESCGGDLELHVETDRWLKFVKAVRDRQQRNTPDLTFNISAVLFYPNGQEPSLIARDVKFGEIPMNVGSRKDFVTVKLNWVSDDYDVEGLSG